MQRRLRALRLARREWSLRQLPSLLDCRPRSRTRFSQRARAHTSLERPRRCPARGRLRRAPIGPTSVCERRGPLIAHRAHFSSSDPPTDGWTELQESRFENEKGMDLLFGCIGRSGLWRGLCLRRSRAGREGPGRQGKCLLLGRGVQWPGRTNEERLRIRPRGVAIFRGQRAIRRSHANPVDPVFGQRRHLRQGTRRGVAAERGELFSRISRRSDSCIRNMR